MMGYAERPSKGTLHTHMRRAPETVLGVMFTESEYSFGKNVWVSRKQWVY